MKSLAWIWVLGLAGWPGMRLLAQEAPAIAPPPPNIPTLPTEVGPPDVAIPEAIPKPVKREPNTLTPDPKDPLLPPKTGKGPLAPEGQQRVRLAAAQLDQEAQTAYAQGDRPKAYQLWFRALRLLQYSGDVNEEIVALGRVGEKAWAEGLAPESQAIAQRLLILDAQVNPQTKAAAPTTELLEQTLITQEKLAFAHEQVGAIDPAIARYEYLLARSRELKRDEDQARWTGKLAQLNLDRFRYPDAEAYTQDQLAVLRRQPPFVQKQPATSAEETRLLQQLAYIQEQNRQWEAAIATQQSLLSRYQDPVLELPKRPALMVAIATNQEKAGQLTAASQTYQDAYKAAQALLQFGVSHEALARLGQLYQRQNQVEDALTVYNVLRRVDELSYDLFGLMTTHEQMANIYESQGNLPQARQALQQALHLARQLNYREAEVAQKLAALPTEE